LRTSRVEYRSRPDRGLVGDDLDVDAALDRIGEPGGHRAPPPSWPVPSGAIIFAADANGVMVA
jgi:hypothetical protein